MADSTDKAPGKAAGSKTVQSKAKAVSTPAKAKTTSKAKAPVTPKPAAAKTVASKPIARKARPASSDKAIAKSTTKRVKSRRAPEAAASKTKAPVSKAPVAKSKTAAKPKTVAKSKTAAKAKSKTLAKAPISKAPVKAEAAVKAKAAAKPKAATKAKAPARASVKAKTKVTPKAKTAGKPKPAAKPKLAAKPMKAAAKSSSKPVVARKPAAKTTAAKKATAKTTAPSKPALKKPAPKPVPAPRTVAEMHTYVEKLGERLKRADATTRRNVRALDTALKAFETRSDTAATNSRAGLIRRIENVKSQLSGLAIDTRIAVRDDLKAALTAEHPRRMAEILFKVDMKLEAAEREQSRAVARLNQHLADMARAMDARLMAMESAQSRETEARRASVDALSGRIDTVEAETARAVTDIGERMVGLATRLREDIEAVRSEAGSTGSGEAAETAVRTQAEFGARLDELSTSVDARLERALRSANDADVRASDLERSQAAMVAQLQARIEGLEHQIVELGRQSHTPSAQVMTLDASSSAPLVAPEIATHPVPMPMTSFEARPFDATPFETAPTAQPVPQPVHEPAHQSAPVQQRDPDMPEHYPVEFVPGAHPAAPAVVPAAAMQAAVDMSSLDVQGAIPAPNIPQPQPAVAVPEISRFDAPAGMPDFAPVPMPSAIQPDAHQGVPQPIITPGSPADMAHITPQITDADLPYTDPGYAEGAGLMRPGGDEGTGSRLPALTPRNLKVAGMAAGVAIVGAFALSQVMGGSDDGASSPQLMADAPAIDGAVASGDVPAVAFTAPKSDISDLAMPMLQVGEPGFDTLEAAVASGNPVAQYQMGLIKYEQRDIPGALALVRASADQGLPAAQYRLAKFHETGQGVPEDLGTAFRLTEMAARQGHRIAMHDTAVFYASGVGGQSPDHAKALDWFEKAARLGVLDSQFNIAHLLHTGQELGIQQDLGSAYVWYAVAAQNGDQEARDRMVTLSPNFTPEQLTGLEARIAEFRTLPLDEAANGVFRDLPWKAPASVRASDVDRQSVRQVQTLLNELGFKTGTPDGIAGAKTREAIVEFERAHDLAETGEPTPELLRELERVAGA